MSNQPTENKVINEKSNKNIDNSFINRREYPRFSLNNMPLPIELEFSKEGENQKEKQQGNIINISKKGVLIGLDKILSSDRVDFKLQIPNSQEPLGGKARIMWEVRQNGNFFYGLYFYHLQHEGVAKKIEEYFNKEKGELSLSENQISQLIKEYRNRQDRRNNDRRMSSIEIDFNNRRIGDRRKFSRRTRKSSKSLHNLIRTLKENEMCPYEKLYDRPIGIEAIQNGKKFLNLSLVDYYNFGQNEEVKQSAHEAIDKYGAGALSAKHSYGYLTILQELENKIATFMKKESTLIFNSGYMANLGAIDSLIGENATIFLDQFSHISLYHSCKLSQKKTFRYANNDMNHLESFLKTHINTINKWIVTLGVFSHTGVLGNMKDIVYLSRKYGARIFIDDAHGVGIYGKSLQGVGDYYNTHDEIDLIMCSFQMAFGNMGAFIVGKKHLLQPAHFETLPYMFTYALPPVNTVSILKALDILNNNGEKLNKQLWENINFFRSELQNIGYKIINPTGHIISFYAGDEIKTSKFTKFLYDNGIWIQSYVPPFAPKGKGLIRITCTANHKKNVLEKMLPIFKEAYLIIK